MRWTPLVAVVLVHCGSPKPSVTVPAPVVTAPDLVEKPVAKPDTSAPEQPKLRLPKNFVPASYTARLAIDPTKPAFDASIAIAGVVAERSTVIWLHGRHLKVTKAAAQQADKSIALTATPKGEDLLELRAASPIEPGGWTLALDYTGEIDPLNTAGVFHQTVADQSYAFTQLEAVYARRVFPCVDEPDNKVPWKLTLDVPKQLVAVSNTPIANETPLDANHKRLEFAPTKPLPPYLVAFAVGPFEVVEAGKSRNGMPIRVLTLAKRANEAQWAAKTAPKILEGLEDWFGTPYPYEKLDLLSIPLTVGFGAMENAGLITFTETLILVDPAKSSRERQHRWVIVAAHEMAHQWFGNLVTMAFWDDIWLNEGFANWMESKVTARVDPAYRDDQAELDVRNGALGDDALVSARQIHQPIASPDDILTAFDGITYDKGASVLGMFESYLGAETFQKGVREYLASKSWGNATSADFAAAMAKASGNVQIEAAFASFLDQSGAPEITATLACTGKPTLQLAQHRYVPPGAPTPPTGKPWLVPVCVAYDKGGARGEACTLLAGDTGSLALDAKTCPRWVMPNINGRGYYRVAYTTADVSALRDEAWNKLSWTERRALYFDIQTAVGNGKLPLQTALSFVPKLLAGNDRFTIGPALGLAAGVDRIVPDELRGKYEYWLRTNFGPGATKAGFVPKDTDTLDLEATRGELVGTVAWVAREPVLVAEAERLADKWRDLPQSIRGLVLAIAADARGDVHAQLMKEILGETDRTRRQEMYRALAGVRDPQRQKAALALVLEPKLDVREAIGMLFDHATDANLAVAQAYFRDHHDAIMKRLPKDEVASPVAGMSALFTQTCKADQRDAVADYVTKQFGHLPGGQRVVAQNVEGMDQCIARRKLLEPEVRAWLQGVRIPKPPKK